MNSIRLFIITLSIIMMIDSKAPLDRKDIVVDLRLHAAGCYHSITLMTTEVCLAYSLA